jgi:hypothetical protein
VKSKAPPLCSDDIVHPRLLMVSYYSTAIFNSVLGVTCDLSTELYLLAELDVTCDQPKISADSILGGVVLPVKSVILKVSEFRRD